MTIYRLYSERPLQTDVNFADLRIPGRFSRCIKRHSGAIDGGFTRLFGGQCEASGSELMKGWHQ